MTYVLLSHQLGVFTAGAIASAALCSTLSAWRTR